MLSVAEARRRILEAVAPVGTEWVALPDGLGRVLARDLHARRTQPPAPVSAMDGYAVRAADTDPPGRWLRVVGEARAGGACDSVVGPGDAVRIFTGAPLPPGADAVAIQENAEREGDRVRFARPSAAGAFVRPAGLDFAEGWRGLEGGRVLDPRALGLAAAMGHAWLPVRRRPRVALLATGDELAWPGETPGPGGIVSSNSVAVGGYVRAWGGEAIDLGIAHDDPASLAEALAQLGAVDLLVNSGGASVGEYDLVRAALGEEGLAVDFWKIAMRPGKPLIFGRFRGVPFVGLPGNPVSAAVCALVYIRAALLAMLGLPTDLPLREGRLAAGLRANDEREDYLRAAVVGWRDGLPVVAPAERQDSSMFATLATSQALVVRPPHAPPAEPGARVEILLLAEAARLPEAG